MFIVQSSRSAHVVQQAPGRLGLRELTGQTDAIARVDRGFGFGGGAWAGLGARAGAVFDHPDRLHRRRAMRRLLPQRHRTGPDGGRFHRARILPARPGEADRSAAGQPVDAGARRPEERLRRRRHGDVQPRRRGPLSRVYSPNLTTGKVDVIDPETFKVIESLTAIASPEHIVPSWDLQTLWVSGDISYSYRGGHADVMPIDPKTGKLGKAIDVPDSYNLYFTPDGKSAIMVAEAMRRLEFRDPHTMELQGYINTAAMRRNQPCRFFARRLLCDLHAARVALHNFAGVLSISRRAPTQ